jgi:GAF domain-containing protein
MSTRQNSEAPSDSLLQAIYEISHEISVNLANEHVLHNTCRQLTEALRLDYVCVARDDPGTAEGVVLAEHPAHLGKGSRLPLEEFGAYHRLQSYRKPVAIAPADAETGPLGPNQPRFEALNLQTLILVPLLVHDDLIGFMILAATQKARTFSQDVMYAIQVVAAQLAISLRNTELFTEIQRRANQLDQLTAFGRMVTSTLDRDMILQHVIEVVPSLLPADHLSVALLSARQPRMRSLL